MTTTPDQIIYSDLNVYAPCHGSNHNHSRKIGTCTTCGDSVVFYLGSLRDVRALGKHRSRQFTCWGAPHTCTDYRAAAIAEVEAQIRNLEASLETYESIRSIVEASWAEAAIAQFEAQQTTTRSQIAALKVTLSTI